MTSMRKALRWGPWLAGLMFTWAIALPQAAAMPAGQGDALDRTVLPIPEPKPPQYTELDVRDATPAPRFVVKAPEGAPNVLVVLVDDLGFAGTSTFGGPVGTPTFEQIANQGIHYNNFHTTAVCSPTRAAIKSGRNHHVNNMGGIIETGTAFPGNTGQIPTDVAPVAEMLRHNGYSTAAFGKWHELAAWEASVSGPLVRWPTGPNGGFDKFYGFLGGETNQWAPCIYDGTHPVELPEDPNYHFLTDMTDQTVAWIKYQKALTPDRPFFVYYAPGATHAPHHVPRKWIERWKGKFDQGWDRLREEILARQIEKGIVPKGTPLAPKPEAIPDWDSLTPDEKKLFTHQVEVFAAYIEMVDHEIGRVVEAVEATGELDNTLIFFVYGDNGTSAEGGRNGMFSEMTYFNGVQEKVEDMLKKNRQVGRARDLPAHGRRLGGGLRYPL
jgi:arylsulfatase A-like enzyme